MPPNGVPVQRRTVPERLRVPPPGSSAATAVRRRSLGSSGRAHRKLSALRRRWVLLVPGVGTGSSTTAAISPAFQYSLPLPRLRSIVVATALVAAARARPPVRLGASVRSSAVAMDSDAPVEPNANDQKLRFGVHGRWLRVRLSPANPARRAEVGRCEYTGVPPSAAAPANPAMHCCHALVRRTGVGRCEYSRVPRAQPTAARWLVRRTGVGRCEYSTVPRAQPAAARIAVLCCGPPGLWSGPARSGRRVHCSCTTGVLTAAVLPEYSRQLYYRSTHGCCTTGVLTAAVLQEYSPPLYYRSTHRSCTTGVLTAAVLQEYSRQPAVL